MLLPVMISAFLIGLTGSFHCVGMCGPIALSLPGNGNGKWMNTILYLAGKTISYTLLGLIFGLFGRQLSISGLQQALSVFAGISLLLIVALLVYNPLKYHENILTTWISKRLLPLFKLVLNNPGKATPLYMGVLNGFLPCGLVYLGLVGSLATGSVLQGGLFMLSFGIGTAPVMLSFLLMAKQFNINYRNSVQKLVPYFLGIIGILLILRGLNLGIPYLSPAINDLPVGPATEVLDCH